MRDYEIDAAERPAATMRRDGRGTAQPTVEGGALLLTAPVVTSLQRSVGNAGVTTLLQAQEEEAAGAKVRDSIAGPGSPLDGAFRAKAEEFLGADLSDVRVHDDTAAAESARSVQANAYTSGHDLVFDEGKYDTHSTDGQHRLMHELSHVVQQSQGPVSGTSTAGRLQISEPTDRFEQAADHVADSFIAGVPASTAEAGSAVGSGDPSVQREGEEDEEEPVQAQAVQREGDEEDTTDEP